MLLGLAGQCLVSNRCGWAPDLLPYFFIHFDLDLEDILPPGRNLQQKCAWQQQQFEHLAVWCELLFKKYTENNLLIFPCLTSEGWNKGALRPYRDWKTKQQQQILTTLQPTAPQWMSCACIAKVVSDNAAEGSSGHKSRTGNIFSSCYLWPSLKGKQMVVLSELFCSCFKWLIQIKHGILFLVKAAAALSELGCFPQPHLLPWTE